MDEEKKFSSEEGELEVPLNEPRKYGWGWIVLVLCFSSDYARRGDPLSDYTLSFAWDMLFFAFIFLYFVLRRRTLAKWCSPGRHLWQGGFAAGLLTCLIAALVLGVMVFFDARSLRSKIVSVDERYKEVLVSFEKEDERIEQAFIVEPRCATELAKNIEMIDELLATMESKKKTSHEMFNDYKATLRNKQNLRARKPWGDVMDRLSAALDKKHEREARAYALLREYYTTGRTEYHREFETVRAEAERLRVEYGKLAKEAFDTRPLK